MRTIIKRLLNALQDPAELREDTPDHEVISKDRHSGLTFYYLRQWVTHLPGGKRYCLQEELSNGTVITHLEDVNWNTLEQYVKAVYIPSSPPKFIITVVGEDC